MARKAYLYLLRHDTSDFYKIGWAYNVEKRLSDLQVGTPIPLILWDSCQILQDIPDRAEQLEDALHNELYDRGLWIRGEWFKLQGENLKYVRDYYRFTDLRRLYRLLVG